MKIKINIKFLLITAIILILSIIILSLIRKQTLANNIEFTSQIYTINNNTITNISPKTTPNTYKQYFDLENCILKIVDNKGNTITTNYVYTGSKTLVYDKNNNLINNYTNIIKGDINSDGEVNIKDLNKLATYLIKENNLDEIEKHAIDLNNDQKIKINDLTILEQYLNSNYENITINKNETTLMTNEQERLIANITPNIILDQNLIWTSNNEYVAKVNEAGLVTAYNEGEAIITATTKDKTKSKYIKITVDNTPILTSNIEKLYTGGADGIINIKAYDYNNLSCETSDANIATCSINDNKLIISPINDGNVKITVKSPSYGEVSTDIEVLFTSLSVFPKSECFAPNQGKGGGIISGFNFGKLSVKSISDKEIITYASINTKGISITSGSKTGDAEVIFTESNGNNTSRFIAHVYKLSLDKTSGTTTINDKLTANIIKENTGELSCQTTSEEIATCTIENNILTITPLNEGEVDITINGSKCGSVSYKATINSGVIE